LRPAIEASLSYSGPVCLHRAMPRPDKTELEFFLLMVPLVVPFAYYAIRTVLR